MDQWELIMSPVLANERPKKIAWEGDKMRRDIVTTRPSWPRGADLVNKPAAQAAGVDPPPLKLHQ